MIEKVYVEGFGAISKLEFPVGLLNIITGPNGYGKSTLFEALSALVSGKIAESDIQIGSDKAFVSAKLKSGNELSRERKAAGKAVTTRINGGRTTASSIAPIIRDAFGDSDKVVNLITNVGKMRYMKMSEVSDILMSILPLSISMKKFIEMGAEVLGRDLTDREKEILASRFEKEPFSFPEISVAYKKTYVDRTAAKRYLDSLNKRTETVVPMPAVSRDAVSEQMQALALRKAASENQARILSAYERMKNDRAAALARKAALQEQLNMLPADEYSAEKEQEIRSEIHNIEEGISKRRANMAAYNQRIRQKSATLDALRRKVCPITQTECLADMSRAISVCEQQISLDKAAVQNEERMISFGQQRCEELRARMDALLKERELSEQRKILSAQIAAVHIPEEPEAPKLEAVISDEEYREQSRKLQDALSAIALYEKYAADVEERKKAAEEVAAIEAVLSLCEAKGVPSLILQAIIGPLNSFANEKAERFGLKVGIDFEDGLKITSGPNGDVPFENLSNGEKMIISVVLVYVINKISNVKLLVLDDMDNLDMNNFRKMLEMFAEDVNSGEFTGNIFLAAAEHQEMEEIINDIPGVNKITLGQQRVSSPVAKKTPVHYGGHAGQFSK